MDEYKEKKPGRRIVLIQDGDGVVERAFVLDGVFSPVELGAAMNRIQNGLPDGRTAELCRIAGTAQCPKSLADLILCVANGDSEARHQEAREAEARESEATGGLLDVLR